MKSALIQLVQEEIRLTAFIHSLDQLKLDANDHLPNISAVVFELLNIETTDELSDKYFEMVASGMQLNKDERRLLAEEIVEFLVK